MAQLKLQSLRKMYLLLTVWYHCEGTVTMNADVLQYILTELHLMTGIMSHDRL